MLGERRQIYSYDFWWTSKIAEITVLHTIWIMALDAIS